MVKILLVAVVFEIGLCKFAANEFSGERSKDSD